MIDLTLPFEALEPPTATSIKGARFSAVRIDGYAQHRLARDEQDAPSLLLSVAARAGSGWAAPIALEHLTVQHDVQCRVSHPDGTVDEGKFTVVRCVSSDPVLHSYFLRVAAPIIVLLGANPTYAAVAQAIDKLVELFLRDGLHAEKISSRALGRAFPHGAATGSLRAGRCLA